MPGKGSELGGAYRFERQIDKCELAPGLGNTSNAVLAWSRTKGTSYPSQVRCMRSQRYRIGDTRNRDRWRSANCRDLHSQTSGGDVFRDGREGLDLGR